MVDKTDNTMVDNDRQHNGQENKGRGGGRQTMVDKTDNTMVKTIRE